MSASNVSLRTAKTTLLDCLKYFLHCRFVHLTHLLFGAFAGRRSMDQVAVAAFGTSTSSAACKEHTRLASTVIMLFSLCHLVIFFVFSLCHLVIFFVLRSIAFDETWLLGQRYGKLRPAVSTAPRSSSSRLNNILWTDCQM